MSSFNALLQSMGGPNKGPKPPVSSATPTNGRAPTPLSQKPSVPAAAKKPIVPTSPAPLKRKADELDSGPSAKALRNEQNGTRPALQKSQSTPAAQSSSPRPATSLPHRSTMRSAAPSAPSSVPAKISKPEQKPSTPSAPAAANGVTKPPVKKAGFSSVLEKAKAAQEAMKAQGSTTIKHKAVERKGTLSTKEKQRREQEEKAKQKQSGKPRAKLAAASGRLDRSRSGTPGSGQEAPFRKKVAMPDNGYRGTMRKAPEPPAYKGTMGKAQPAQQRSGSSAGSKPGQKRSLDSLAKAEHGGYASWSDLDDDDELEEEDYDSEGSSDMEAGIDDVELEEARALREARKEDAEEQAREAAHAREKAEKRRRLEATKQRY